MQENTDRTECSASGRRGWLQTTACGFGALALQGIHAGALEANDGLRNAYAPMPMFGPRAKRVIFLFMQGGPSHLDTFDFKEELVRAAGKTVDFTGVRFGDFGKASQRPLMPPLWKFRRYGECGQAVSELFPQIAEHVDKLCFLKGMHTDGVAHGPATLFMHTGATNLVRPSLGSWLIYGLGSENRDLPGFISLRPSDTKGGPRNYSNAFLPAYCQGTPMGRAEQPVEQMRIDHLAGGSGSSKQRRTVYELTQRLSRLQRERAPESEAVDGIIRSYELAWRMQREAPEVMDLGAESRETQTRYGIGVRETDEFGRQCLMARRLCEAGVRFVQVNYSDDSPNPRWDQHSGMKRHEKHARATDQPVAALLEDLDQRGLLEDTVVWWGGEFGRTPFSQNNDGRDHNPTGFTAFLAGGGVRAGFSYGATDEIGLKAVEGKVHMHDLHATLLHLLGIDHERLTYRHAGRDFRLTDLYGRVIQDIIA